MTRGSSAACLPRARVERLGYSSSATSSPCAPGADPDCERQECSSWSEWAIWRLKPLKLHHISLHYFFHLEAISCCWSLAAPGDLSSRLQPFLLLHFTVSSKQESSLAAHHLSALGCCCRVPVGKACSQNTQKLKPHDPCCTAKKRKGVSEEIFVWLPCFLAQKV